MASGPHAVDLLERFLEILADHPAPVSRELEAFGLLNAMTAMFVQNELAATASSAARRTAYLRHVAAAGTHPRVAAAPPPDAVGADPFDGAIGRVLNGLLGLKRGAE